MKAKEVIEEMLRDLDGQIKRYEAHEKGKYPPCHISYDVGNDASDAMAFWVHVYKASLTNNISESLEIERLHRLNRKWQRIFIALIITNIIIYSQII